MELSRVEYKGYVIDAIEIRHTSGKHRLAAVRLGRPGVPVKEYGGRGGFDNLKKAEEESISMGKRIIDGQEEHVTPP